MDFGTLIIGGVVALFCALPFVYAYLSRQKQQKLIREAMQQAAASASDQITDYEVFGTQAMGISASGNWLFFGIKQHSVWSIKSYNLKDFANSALQSEHRDTPNGQVIKKIELVLHPKSSDKPKEKFIFFDEDKHVQHDGELLSAQQWMVKINALLAS